VVAFSNITITIETQSGVVGVIMQLRYRQRLGYIICFGGKWMLLCLLELISESAPGYDSLFGCRRIFVTGVLVKLYIA